MESFFKRLIFCNKYIFLLTRNYNLHLADNLLRMEDSNQEKNRLHYEKLYTNFPIENILYCINNLKPFLDSAISTDLSWHALYQKNFREKLDGKRVLEMGCGDCTNAAVMAALGAEVYANDIAESSGEIIKKLNELHKFKYPIIFVEGDFLENNLLEKSFDYVVGKAFLHHLTLPIEEKFLREAARLLKSDGEARFFEPAVNSKILDTVRWYIPVKGRPSKLNQKAYNDWKEKDPHPDRPFSSKHWERAGRVFFKEVEIIPIGTLERFNKFIRRKEKNIKFRQWALKAEKKLPSVLNHSFARSQLLIYSFPNK